MKGYHFDEAHHVHTFDGERMYGVTSVLKSWGDPGMLINWAANQAVDAIERGEKPEDARKAHIKKRDKAGDKGTAIHAELEVALNVWIDKGHVPVTNNVIKDVIDWMVSENIEPVKSEMPVYSIDKFYAGICDAVIVKDNKKYILDFKTSGTVQTKAFIQCGAYSVAIKDMKKNAVIDGVVVVHIPKGESFNPEKNVYWFYAIEELETAWLSILSAYKTDQSLQKLIKW